MCRPKFRNQGLEEAELGLYFTNVHWYDPSLGRFTQPDSLVPNPINRWIGIDMRM